MKAITLYQPWASAIACVLKTHETRSWRTKFRGPLAIHASKAVPKKVRDSSGYWDLYQQVMDAVEGDEPSLPASSIVTVCLLQDCVPTESITCPHSCYPWQLAEHELDFGDYAPGRFAWRLDEVLDGFVPIPCSGARGLWDVPLDVLKKIIAC